MRAAFLLLTVLCSSGLALAQVNRDDIDRNLQERAAREREFHVELEPAAPIQPPSAVLERSRVMLPTPGTELFEVPGPRLAPSQQNGAVRARPGANRPSLLTESQRRRQLELQSQTRPLDETARRPLLDTQQLQFEREQRADRLQLEIMRNSERALRGR